MDQGGGEVEPALHPSGVRADAAPEGVADVDQLPQGRQAGLRLDLGQAVEAGLEPEQLDAGLLAVERRVL